jgi:hypothetical protein
LSELYFDEHWDEERADRVEQGFRVEVSSERPLNPEMGAEPLTLSELQLRELAEMNWTARRDGEEPA